MKLANAIKHYWCLHNVTNHHCFKSESESLDYLNWRNKCYLHYEKYMPVNQADDKVVLDFGCGPGHDLVGFSQY